MTTDEMIFLYRDEGLTLAQVARLAGCARQTVANRLKKAGVEIRSAHPSKFTEQSRQELKRLYVEEGLSTLVLSERYRVAVQTVIDNLVKLGVTIRTRGGSLTAEETKDRDRQMVERYSSGASSLVVGEKFGVSHEVVLSACRRMGVPVRTRSDYGPRTYFYDFDFFKQWTPDMSYVLGLFATDGNMDKNLGRWSIYQKEIDLLHQVQVALGAEEVPLTYQGTNQSVPTLRLNHQGMVQDLMALGFTPNKSHTVRVPPGLQYPQDFIRGVFDGDGWGACYRKREGNRPLLRIGLGSVSPNFIQDILDLLPIQMGGPYGPYDYETTITHDGVTYGPYKPLTQVIMTSSEEDALALRDWMYSGDSQIHSKRKKAKLFN